MKLEASNVPAEFGAWIPLAEKWGIGDDYLREQKVATAGPDELDELLGFRVAYDAVANWLAGPESYADSPSKEYVAFTCLTMAWDSANLKANGERYN